MLTVILDMAFTEEGLDGFLANARAGLPDTRKYPGSISLVVLQDQNDPRRITFYEQWRSREDYDAYLAWRTSQGLIDALMEQCSEPPSWRYFDTMDL